SVPEGGGTSQAECRFALDLSANEITRQSLLIPSFADSVQVTINGQRVAATDVFVMRNLRFANIPAFVALSDTVLREGRNEFGIVLSALPRRTASLDRIFFGPEAELRPRYHGRW